MMRVKNESLTSPKCNARTRENKSKSNAKGKNAPSGIY